LEGPNECFKSGVSRFDFPAAGFTLAAPEVLAFPFPFSFVFEVDTTRFTAAEEDEARAWVWWADIFGLLGAEVDAAAGDSRLFACGTQSIWEGSRIEV